MVLLAFLTLNLFARLDDSIQPAVASHATDKAGKSFINLETVRHLYCGANVGTGEIVRKDQVFTAAHVVGKSKQCIDRSSGTVGEVIHYDRNLDIAVLQFPVGQLPSRFMRYKCSGFTAGSPYYAIGWARGTELVINKVAGTSVVENRAHSPSGTLFNHVALVDGDIIPGMSGGPVVDADGVMVGTNQATNNEGQSWSRPISDTYLCETQKKGQVSPPLLPSISETYA